MHCTVSQQEQEAEIAIYHVTLITTDANCVCVCLQDEKQRIEALGGCVIWFGTWRVNGSLSVSRAIGKL